LFFLFFPFFFFLSIYSAYICDFSCTYRLPSVVRSRSMKMDSWNCFGRCQQRKLDSPALPPLHQLPAVWGKHMCTVQEYSQRSGQKFIEHKILGCKYMYAIGCTCTCTCTCMCKPAKDACTCTMYMHISPSNFQW